MTHFSPAPQFTTKEAYAYQVLREAILTGQLSPGDRLVMDRLSKEMGISPIPLRGALQRLESEGLVDITPHSGAVVAPVAQEEIGEIFLLLELLEAQAFRAAAGQVNDEILARLTALVEEMDQAAASGDLETWAQANDRFHREIASLSKMRLLTELTGRVLDHWARLRRSFAPVLANNLERAQVDHHQMLALLSAGDGEALAELAANHNRRASAAYEKSL